MWVATSANPDSVVGTAGAGNRGVIGARGVWGGLGAPISAADSASALGQRLGALRAPKRPGNVRPARSLALRWAHWCFENQRLTSARPCRALPLLQPAGGCVPPRPRWLPLPACPHLDVDVEGVGRVDSRLRDPRVLWKESVSEGTGELRGGIGVVREQVRASGPCFSAVSNSGPPFSRII